ncbi:MAG: hypothetical protein ACOVN3_04925, partial [Limnohabitans sp.]
NQNVPFNKWQTYVFVGEDQVNASLVQATDANNERIYVDEYGRIAPYSEVKDELTTDKTQLFSLDELTNKKVSEPAEVSGVKIPEGEGAGQYDWIGGMNKAALTDLLTDSIMTVDIDQSGVPVEISLAKLTDYGTSTDKITGDLIAEEMTNQLIKGFGLTRTSGTTAPIKTGEPKFGMSVIFDAVNKKFVIKSGTTGDTSSVSVTGITTAAASKLGFGTTFVPETTPPQIEYLFTPEEKPLNVATRGIVSSPAIAFGSPPSINTATNFKVDASNNKFIVTVDGIKETFTLNENDYSIDDFTLALQNRINAMVEERTDGLTPREINGVKVSFDPDKKVFKFVSGTTGSSSFIKVSAEGPWGLSNVEAGRGTTSTWIKPMQHVDRVNGIDQLKYIDGDGNETTSSDGFDKLPKWSPVFLDKGELTFDTGGNLVSPVEGTQ